MRNEPHGFGAIGRTKRQKRHMKKRKTFHKPVRSQRSDPSRRTYKGVVYDSIAEMGRAPELDLLMQQLGPMWTWSRQVKIQLGEDFATKVDFVIYRGDEAMWAEEIKGFDTPQFKTVLRLWKKYQPMELRILRPRRGGWVTETIERNNDDGPESA